MKPEIQNRAFKMYLAQTAKQSKSAALDHIYQCLRGGEQGNMAWELMAEAHGDKWSCQPQALVSKITEALDYAIEQAEAS